MENVENKLVQIADNYENGDINSLDALIEIREIKKQIDNCLDNIKQFEDYIQDDVANECQNYPNGYKDKKVSVMSGRKTYSYKGIQVIEDAEKEVKYLKKQLENLVNKGQNIVEENDIYYYKDEEGLIQLPSVSYTKSFIRVENVKTK